MDYMAQSNLYVYDPGKGKKVKAGYLIGNVFYKSVIRKKHFLRVVRGYAIQCSIIGELKKRGIEKILFIEDGGKRKMGISLTDFLFHCGKWTKGHGEQYTISEKYLF